ncbi:MAG: hypothetical protein ACLPZR_31860 [Solirubrobacteraceae bacterium]
MTTTGLADALRAQGGTVADALVEVQPGAADGDGAPQLAAAGPRTAGRARDYELLLEMILEGSLLHYGSPRVLRCEDPDLALLLGDQLYALGLSRLAELGDLEAVSELADLISLEAQARSVFDDRLAQAVWMAGAAAIGWGPTPEHEAAKALARAHDDGAAEALDAARRAVISAARTSCEHAR